MYKYKRKTMSTRSQSHTGQLTDCFLNFYKTRMVAYISCARQQTQHDDDDDDQDTILSLILFLTKLPYT